MILPNTIFVAFGVITASTIAGVFSYISLINQKEGKISEFRQNWIDELRKDTSQYCADVYRIHNAWQIVHEIKVNNPAKTQSELLEKFFELTAEQLQSYHELSVRILLRLNVKDDDEQIDLLRQINNFLNSRKDFDEMDKLNVLIERLITHSQILLKTEWEKVKAGEKAYKRTKAVSNLIIWILFIVLTLSVWAYSTNKLDFINVNQYDSLNFISGSILQAI